MADFLPELKKKNEEAKKQQEQSVDEQNAALLKYLMDSGTARIESHAS